MLIDDHAEAMAQLKSNNQNSTYRNRGKGTAIRPSK